jgi:fumarate reductase subunit C
MLTHPDRIGPTESADRVWTDLYWPLYLVLLFVVELHAGIGIYRLCVKWGWFAGKSAEATRKRLAAIKWSLTAFFLVLGLTTLAAYIKIGIAHAGDYGKPYEPAATAAVWSAGP